MLSYQRQAFLASLTYLTGSKSRSGASTSQQGSLRVWIKKKCKGSGDFFTIPMPWILTGWHQPWCLIERRPVELSSPGTFLNLGRSLRGWLRSRVASVTFSKFPTLLFPVAIFTKKMWMIDKNNRDREKNSMNWQNTLQFVFLKYVWVYKLFLYEEFLRGSDL